MRILLVHCYYRLRGGEDVVFDTEAEMLAARGHEVVRYTKRNEDFVQQGRIAKTANTIWNRRVVRELTQLIHEHRIDVAHFHNTFPAISPAAIRAAHQAGAATVLTLHNSRYLCAAAVCYRDHQPCTMCLGKSFGLPAIQHACFQGDVLASGVVVLNNWVHRTHRTLEKHLDVAIAPTRFVKHRYESAHYPISQIVVKPHFVDQNLAAGDGSGGYALFVGRLSEEKGVRTLIDAWSKLRGRLPLKIIGQGLWKANCSASLESIPQTVLTRVAIATARAIRSNTLDNFAKARSTTRWVMPLS